MKSKLTIFSSVAVGARFAWRGQAYVKATSTTAGPIERDNKMSEYRVEIPAIERVVAEVL